MYNNSFFLRRNDFLELNSEEDMLWFLHVLVNYNSTTIVHAFHQAKNSWKIERNLHFKRQSNFPVTRIIRNKMRICFFQLQIESELEI